MSTTGSEEKDVEFIPRQSDLKVEGGDESLELTPQELRRLRRIVDWRILPYISLISLLSEFGGCAQRSLSHSHATAGFAHPQVSWTE